MTSSLLLAAPCLAAEPQWYPFIWEDASMAPGMPVEHAALLLPARLNGIDCTVQLDTGANVAFIWHGASLPGEAQSPLRIELGGRDWTIPASASHIASIEQGRCGGLLSAGNALFEQGTLTLDLARRRYAYSPAALLAGDSAAQPLIYAQWYNNGGHVLVELRLPSGKLGYAMLDTGAARFGLSALSPQGWAEITGGLPLAASASVKEFKVNSWGKQISCHESMAAGPLLIGGMYSVPRFDAAYCALDSFKPGQQLIGLLGLRDFGDSTIILDYLSRRWLVR